MGWSGRAPAPPARTNNPFAMRQLAAREVTLWVNSDRFRVFARCPFFLVSNRNSDLPAKEKWFPPPGLPD
jgi:hypothetical protein